MVLACQILTAVVSERVKRSAQSTLTGDFYKLSFQAMNTVCRVHFRTEQRQIGSGRAGRGFAVGGLVRSSLLCVSFPDSLIGRINSAAGQQWVDVDPETDALLNLCQEMIFFTRGVFDPTSLPLIRCGIGKATRRPFLQDPRVQAAQELVGWRKIQRRPGAIFFPRAGMCLDLGGIGRNTRSTAFSLGLASAASERPGGFRR